MHKESGSFNDILYKQVSLWASVISLAGLIIGSFLYLTNPSRDNDTAIQLQEQRIAAQEKTINDLTKTQQNDTQEVKKAISDQNIQIQLLTNSFTQLSTIIDERIPKK